jgi:DNA-directed RNA polymerase subunit K/omega
MDLIFNDTVEEDIEEIIESDNIGDEHDILVDDDDDDIKPVIKKSDTIEDIDDNLEVEDDIEDDPIIDDDIAEILPESELIETFVNPESRITSEYMSRYEFVKIVGIRATQISQGSIVFTDIGNLTNPIDMATKEVYDNKCPLMVKRYIGLNKYELWSARELIKKNYK